MPFNLWNSSCTWAFKRTSKHAQARKARAKAKRR
jgi:hypothetical protein